jgi:hypothetical protein
LGEFSPIGRFFAYWATVYFVRFLILQSYIGTPHFGILFSAAKVMPKMGWATFWAIFSQTQPVTLLLTSSRSVFFSLKKISFHFPLGLLMTFLMSFALALNQFDQKFDRIKMNVVLQICRGL